MSGVKNEADNGQISGSIGGGMMKEVGFSGSSGVDKSKVKDLLLDGELRLSVTRTWFNRTLSTESSEWKSLRTQALNKCKNACRFCGWRFSKFMVCDHINGDASDNRLENLGINCPGCDKIRHCGRNAAELELRVSKMPQVDIAKRTYEYYAKNKKVPRPEEIDPECKDITLYYFKYRGSKLRFADNNDVTLMANLLMKIDYDISPELKAVKGFFNQRADLKHMSYQLDEKLINTISDSSILGRKGGVKSMESKRKLVKTPSPPPSVDPEIRKAQDDKVDKYKNPEKKFNRFLKKQREKYSVVLDMEWNKTDELNDISDKSFRYQGNQAYQIAYCVFNESFTDVKFKNHYISNSIKSNGSRGYYKGTVDELNRVGKNINVVLRDMMDDISMCEMIIGQNLEQDVEILRAHLLRSDMYTDIRKIDAMEQYCMMKKPKKLMNLKDTRGASKAPNKNEVYKFFLRKDMPLDNNHDALWDVKHELLSYLAFQEYLKENKAVPDEKITQLLADVETKFNADL